MKSSNEFLVGLMMGMICGFFVITYVYDIQHFVSSSASQGQKQ